MIYKRLYGCSPYNSSHNYRGFLKTLIINYLERYYLVLIKRKSGNVIKNLHAIGKNSLWEIRGVLPPWGRAVQDSVTSGFKQCQWPCCTVWFWFAAWELVFIRKKNRSACFLWLASQECLHQINSNTHFCAIGSWSIETLLILSISECRQKPFPM